MPTTTFTTLTGKNIRKCETCAASFKARSAKSTARFCSKKCGGERLKSRVTKICVQCGISKDVPTSHANRSANFCCSRNCSLSFRNAHPELRSEAISRGAKAKWQNDTKWAAEQRAAKNSRKKPKIVVHVAADAPIVRYPFFNAVGRLCAHCNRTILVRPGNKEPHVFCNRQCSGRWKASNLVGEKHPRYAHESVILTCHHCKKEFQRKPYFLGRWKTRFCSKNCKLLHMQSAGYQATLPEHSTVLWPDSRAYEQQIAAMASAGYNRGSAARKLKITLGQLQSFLNRLDIRMHGTREYVRGLANPQYLPRVPITCAQCGIVKERAPYYVKNSPMYCSRRCLHRSRYQGGTITYRGEDWGRQRKAARCRDNGNCQLCGVHKGDSIDVHHIRAFRLFDSNVEANDLRNLVCLCRSCHLKVEGTTNNADVDTWQDAYIAHLRRKAGRLEKRNRSRRLIFLTGFDDES